MSVCVVQHSAKAELINATKYFHAIANKQQMTDIMVLSSLSVTCLWLFIFFFYLSYANHGCIYMIKIPQNNYI